MQRDDTITPINFCMLDASTLKFAIMEHCNEWQNRFTNLLYEMTCAKLQVCTLICNLLLDHFFLALARQHEPHNGSAGGDTLEPGRAV